MSILVTNDDGISSAGMWTMVGELSKLSRVTVVAPSKEQSAIGTAVSLRQAVRVQRVASLLPGVETYSVDGTPSDAVILGLGKLVQDTVRLVVSGINQGTNLGEDVHISGTVGAALQAYLRGFPAVAVSAACTKSQHLETAARVAGIVAERILSDLVLTDVFLNVNLPDLAGSEIKGARVTRLASESHINTIEDGGNGQKDWYRLVRHSLARGTDGTDVHALEQGNISITPLYTRRFNKASLPLLNGLCDHLLRELRKNCSNTSAST